MLFVVYSLYMLAKLVIFLYKSSFFLEK